MPAMVTLYVVLTASGFTGVSTTSAPNTPTVTGWATPLVVNMVCAAFSTLADCTGLLNRIVTRVLIGARVKPSRGLDRTTCGATVSAVDEVVKLLEKPLAELPAKSVMEAK